MEDNTFLVYEHEEIGKAHVTEEVVAAIAGLAAVEVEGVECLANGAERDSIAKLGRKKLASSVKIIEDGMLVDVNIALVVRMGYNIPKICKSVQEKIRSGIEGVTGIKVGNVNIEIANIKVEK